MHAAQKASFQQPALALSCPCTYLWHSVHIVISLHWGVQCAVATLDPLHCCWTLTVLIQPHTKPCFQLDHESAAGVLVTDLGKDYVRCNSLSYWAIVLSIIPFILAITFLVRAYLVKYASIPPQCCLLCSVPTHPLQPEIHYRAQMHTCCTIHSARGVCI